MILRADPDFSHKDCTVVSYSAFGELSLWSKAHNLVTVDLAEGTISSEWLASTEFVAGFVPPPPPGEPDPNVIACGAIRYDEEDWDYFDFMGDEMLKRCIKAHGALELGQCYGFVPALALAGAESPMRNVDNIQRVSALEHFALLAQLQPFRLIQLTANGIETVREIG